VSAVAEASSVLLARYPGSAEVFLVERALTLRFMGGFHAFPGGQVHPEDHDLAARLPVPRPSFHVAAVRELFEETGVLLARGDDGSFPSSEPLDPLRQELLAEHLSFAAVLARLGLHLEAQDLIPAGTLVTPPFASARFDTEFYVANLPPGQEAEVWPGELTTGRWTSAEAALRDWYAGSLLLSPPTLALLELLQGQPIAALPRALAPVLKVLATGVIPRIWFSPGVLMIPLRSQVLPPASHTNAYLVGSGPRYLLDPGAADPAEHQRLFAVLDSLPLPAGQAPVDGVILSHHHPDHVGAASACARRYAVPILAHPLTARALAGQLSIDRLLEDGSSVDLGQAPHGRGRWHLEVLHTPGHAPGHLAFYEPHYRLLFVADLVSTLSSIIVAPPEGDLPAYLASLRRLREYPARLLLPAHGGVSSRPQFVLDKTLAHRQHREEQLRQALSTSPRTLADLVREIYQGLPVELRPLAELQTLGGLVKLHKEGVAQPSGDGWVSRAEPG
jgi:ribonuclease/clavin/mitogillin